MADSSQPNENQSPRDEILAMLKDEMDALHERSTTDASVDEDLQLKRARTLGYLANQYRKLKRDTDIDEMEDELALLQAAEDE